MMKATQSMITIENLHPRKRVSLTRLKKYLSRVFAPKKMVGVVFVDDKYISKLAGQFRNSPHPTDVLTFYYGEDDLLGEVVISLDTASRQAKSRSLSLFIELLLLSVHGFLHLSGQGDEKLKDWCEMRKKEFETMMRIL